MFEIIFFKQEGETKNEQKVTPEFQEKLKRGSIRLASNLLKFNF